MINLVMISLPDITISKTTSQSCLVSDVFSAGVGFGLKCVLTI
jgi:hypothetical protein